jgi:hypothetical protein
MPPFESLEADRVAPERCSPLARGAARTVPWEVRRACESIDSEAGGHARSFASQRCVVSPDSVERRSSGSARDRLQRLLCPSNGRRDRVGGRRGARGHAELARTFHSRRGRGASPTLVACTAAVKLLPRVSLSRSPGCGVPGKDLSVAAQAVIARVRSWRQRRELSRRSRRSQPPSSTLPASAAARRPRLAAATRSPCSERSRRSADVLVFERRDRRPCGRGYYASLPPASQLMGRYGDICLTRNITTAVTPK